MRIPNILAFLFMCSAMETDEKIIPHNGAIDISQDISHVISISAHSF